MALAVADSAHKYLLGSASGTSASAPLWGALVALADQYAHRDLGFVNRAIYSIASVPLGRAAFHDITVGSNTATVDSVTVPGYQAAPGWDPVTGWGTPNAQVLVPALARRDPWRWPGRLRFPVRQRCHGLPGRSGPGRCDLPEEARAVHRADSRGG